MLANQGLKSLRKRAYWGEPQAGICMHTSPLHYFLSAAASCCRWLASTQNFISYSSRSWEVQDQGAGRCTHLARAFFWLRQSSGCVFLRLSTGLFHSSVLSPVERSGGAEPQGLSSSQSSHFICEETPKARCLRPCLLMCSNPTLHVHGPLALVWGLPQRSLHCNLNPFLSSSREIKAPR